MKKIILLCVMCGLLAGCATTPKYEGELKDGKRHGQGTYIDEGGNKYEGQWENDKMHGQGVYTRGYWNSEGAEKYEGQWKDGKYHGQGTITWRNGDKYEGRLENGLRHGQGTYTWSDGGKYEGQWEDDKKHGQGAMYDSKGKIFDKGIYINGHYIFGKYVGELKDVKPASLIFSEKGVAGGDVSMRLLKVDDTNIGWRNKTVYFLFSGKHTIWFRIYINYSSASYELGQSCEIDFKPGEKYTVTVSHKGFGKFETIITGPEGIVFIKKTEMS